MLTCPHCHKQLQFQTAICPYCAKDILVACKLCKAYTDPQTATCSSCGQVWNTEPELHEPEANTATFAAQITPKLLASKIISQHYARFFAVSEQGPLILAYLFGTRVDSRTLNAALLFAALSQLVVEGYCTFERGNDPQQPGRRYLRPVRQHPWDGQTDSLEAGILRDSGDEISAVLFGFVTSLARPVQSEVDERGSAAVVGFMAAGARGALLGYRNAAHYKRDEYDKDVAMHVGQLVNESYLPPHDPEAACHQVYTQMLQLYQYDPEGTQALAKACYDAIMAV